MPQIYMHYSWEMVLKVHIFFQTPFHKRAFFIRTSLCCIRRCIRPIAFAFASWSQLEAGLIFLKKDFQLSVQVQQIPISQVARKR